MLLLITPVCHACSIQATWDPPFSRALQHKNNSLALTVMQYRNRTERGGTWQAKNQLHFRLKSIIILSRDYQFPSLESSHQAFRWRAFIHYVCNCIFISGCRILTSPNRSILTPLPGSTLPFLIGELAGTGGGFSDLPLLLPLVSLLPPSPVAPKRSQSGLYNDLTLLLKCFRRI